MTDRLALIKARHAEAGGGDADKAWLIRRVEAEWDTVERLSARIQGAEEEMQRQRRHREWLVAAARHSERERLRWERTAAPVEEERDVLRGEVEQLRAKLKEYEDFTAPIRQAYEPGSNTAQAVLDEALNSGRGEYKP